MEIIIKKGSKMRYQKETLLNAIEALETYKHTVDIELIRRSSYIDIIDLTEETLKQNKSTYSDLLAERITDEKKRESLRLRYWDTSALLETICILQENGNDNKEIIEAFLDHCDRTICLYTRFLELGSLEN